MVAGISLAIPNLNPGLIEKWNNGLRSRMSFSRMLAISFASSLIAASVILGSIFFVNKEAGFLAKLWSFVIEVGISSALYFGIMRSSFNSRMNNIGITRMEEIDSEERFKAFVGLNWSMLFGSLLLLFVPGIITQVLIAKGLGERYALTIFTNTVFSAFFMITSAMAIVWLLVLAFVRIANSFNQKREKPLWWWVLTIFILGCTSQAVGSFVG